MSMSSHANEASNMPLDQLRAERDRLRHEEDAVSFVRRLAQGRIDLVEAVRHRKSSGESTSAADIIRSGVGPAPSTGSARPPRDTEVAADHPLVTEFDQLCDRLGFDEMSELEVADLCAHGRVGPPISRRRRLGRLPAPGLTWPGGPIRASSPTADRFSLL
jgi:hypothetical protein